MKRTISLLLAVVLLLCLAPAGCAEEESFAALAGLDTIQAALDEGVSIVSLYYTDGYGFSTSEFYTEDAEVIGALLDALREISLKGRSEVFVTDWYPQLVLDFSDGTRFGIFFDGHCLDKGDTLYELKNDGAFWLLTAALVREYAASGQTPPPLTEPEPEPTAEAYIPNCVDLYFPANPTTGYSWTAEIEDGGIVALREQYFADSHELGFTGAGGTQWYHLDGVGAGVTSVHFRYARPWEDTALTAFTYRLQVNERGDVLIWGVEMTTE